MIIILVCLAGGGILLLWYLYTFSQTLPEVALSATPSPTPTRTQDERVATVQAQFTAAARAQPTPIPTPTKPGPTPTFSNILLIFKSDALGFSLQYPDGWQKREYEEYIILSSSPEALNGESFKGFSIWFGRSSDETSLSKLRLLLNLPDDLETFQEGMMEIGGSTWNTVQIRFKDITSQTQMHGALAVLAKDGQAYFMVAIAPEADWDNLRPIFQVILRSFRFLDR